MKLGRRSSLADVAVATGDALRRAGIRAVLTGGACANLYSGGVYQSFDSDFVLAGRCSTKDDACRDRLAAFYFWNDLQSLAAAVAIAVRNRVAFAKVRAWSRSEGHPEGYAVFLAELRRTRVAADRGRSSAVTNEGIPRRRAPAESHPDTDSQGQSQVPELTTSKSRSSD